MKLKRYSVLRVWILSYLVVLLIPIITVFVNNRINVNTIRREYVKAGALSLNNVKDNIDHYLSAQRDWYAYAYLRDSFNTVRYSVEKDNDFYAAVRQFHKEMNEYHRVDDTLHYMVYLEQHDFIIEGTMAGDANDYFATLGETEGSRPDYETWQKVCRGEYANEFFVASAEGWFTGETSLVYANTMSDETAGRKSLFVSVPISLFADNARSLTQDAYLVMEVGEDQLVFWDGQLVDASVIDQVEEYEVLSLKSDRKGILYHLYIPEEVIVQELSGLVEGFWINLSITLALGLLGIGILVGLNYRPVFRLMKNVDALPETYDSEEYGEEDGEGEENEFQRIARAYQKQQKEKKLAEQTVNRQQNELRSTELLAYMKGRASKTGRGNSAVIEELDENLLLCGFRVPGKRGEAYDELSFFVIDNIFTELMGQEKFYHVEDGRYIFYICSNDAVSEEWRRSLKDKMVFLCDMLRDKCQISVLAIISEFGDKGEGLRFLYRDVVTSLEYAYMMELTGLTDVRDLHLDEDEYMIRDYMNQEFREAFATQNMDRAYAVSEKIFATDGSVSEPMIRIYAYEAFKQVVDIFMDYVADRVQQAKALDYLELLNKSRDTDQIKTSFNELLRFAGEGIFRQQTMEERVVIAKIKNYIAEHYTDYNLNIGFMAEQLGMNSRYLSRVFKEEMGIGVLDYISQCRIMKAKELMLNEKLSLKEVSRLVGYVDERTFRRAFIKVEGKPPSSFGVKS